MQTSRSSAAIAPLAFLALTSATIAQEASPLPELVVSASRTLQSRIDVPASVNTVNAEAIRSMGPQVNLSEALQRVPGLTVLNRQNFAQDLQLSSRGFGARATFGVRGVRLYADGIPATMPDGSGQSASFDLGSASRIEVLRGPAAALYGNAAGGVVQVFTEDGPPTPEVSVNLAAGRDGMTRQQLKLAGEIQGINYVLSASRFETEGYRTHSAARRDQFNAKLRWRLQGEATLSMVGSYLNMPDIQDPLGLTWADWRASPSSATAVATTYDTRKDLRNAQLGLVYELPVHGDTARLMVYNGQRQVQQFQSIPPSAQTDRHPGGVIAFQRDYRGLDGRYTWRSTLLSEPLTVTGGLALDDMDEARQGYQNFVGSHLGVQGALRRDEDNKARNIDQYLVGEWVPQAAWLFTAGVRHSQVRFVSQDHYITSNNGDDSGSMQFEATTPTVAAQFKLSADWRIHLSTGRSFETPSLAEVAYKSNAGTETGWNTVLRPSKARHVELGIKGRPAQGAQWDATLFQTHTDDEIAVARNEGGRATYQNVGRTQRTGFESSLDWTLPEGVSLHAALTLLDATFRDSFVSNGTQAIAAGNQLPGVPSHQFYGELAWRPGGTGWQTALEVRKVSGLWANDVNDERAPGAVVWAARAGWQTAGGSEHAPWRLSALARIDNLVDRRYVGSVIVNEGSRRYHESAPGRTLTVMATLVRGF